MSEPEKQCADCRCPLTRIIVMDERYGGMKELRYALPREKAAIFPTTSGTLQGWVCPECHRMTMYAAPDKGAPQPGRSASK